MRERVVSLDRRLRQKTHPEDSPYLTRQDILARDLKRALYRFIEHLPEANETVNEIRQRSGDTVARAFADRIVETTYHPSHTLPPEFYLALAESIKKIWQDFKTPGTQWDQAAMEARAQQESHTIMAEASGKLDNLADSAIQSNAGLDATEVLSLQRHISNDLDELVTTKRQASSSDPSTPTTTEMAWAAMTEPELRQILDNLPMTEPADRFDESKETVLEAKIVIFNGVADEHHVWVDFDGAKRAEGHTYSKYAALIYEDIMHNFTLLQPAEQRATVALYQEFRRLAALNHALSSLLKDPSAIPKPKLLRLEQMLDILKRARYEKLSALIRIKNDIKQTNHERGQNKIIYLSDRVKFMPRLDHKTIQAAIDAQYNQTKATFEPERKVDQSQRAMLHNILNQVLEINQLTQENRRWQTEATVTGVGNNAAEANGLMVPQIMLAMSEGAQDVIALNAELDELKRKKARTADGRFHYNAEISSVPLFETESTVQPAKITSYLETMWEYYGSMYGAEAGREKFSLNINEIFFAGSDLSKEVGQTSAMVKVWETYAAIDQFNKKYDTDVRLKLGTGEAPFRQGGLWDPEGYLPMVRGKILEYQPLSPVAAQKKFGGDWKQQQTRERQAVSQKTTFLTKTFGADWPKRLKRQPRGFNRLLQTFPFINSFTEQSFAKELTIWNIDPVRLEKMKREAESTHDQNINALKTGEFAAVPETLKTAAEAEQTFYQKIFGKKGQPKSMFGRLLQMCAKSLPAPVLRDRPLGRDDAAGDPIKFFNKLAEPHIDARAIAANSTSGFLFPLYLMGKGSMLDSARQRGQLTEVLPYVDAKEMLRQMKIYGEIAPDIFTMLRESGMEADAALLQEEWEKLCSVRSDVQAAMWQQASTPEADLTKLTATEKKQFAECCVPGMRELLTDDFASDRTKLFRKNFEQHRTIITTTMEYVRAGYDVTDQVQATVHSGEASSAQELLAQLDQETPGISPDLQARYARFEQALEKKSLITAEDYGTFLANVVSCYSPGM